VATTGSNESAIKAIFCSLVALAMALLSIVIFRSLASSPCGSPVNCPTAEAAEPLLKAATPADGLFRFGALGAVWNFHHPLTRDTSWNPNRYQGFQPATASDRTRFTLSVLADSQRVTNVEAYFVGDVTRERGRAALTHELPRDAVRIHPAAPATQSGCVFADFYRSPLLSRAMGPTLIRVQYDTVGPNDYGDPFNYARIEAVPVNDPCRFS
jgi:hypothetical protein